MGGGSKRRSDRCDRRERGSDGDATVRGALRTEEEDGTAVRQGHPRGEGSAVKWRKSRFSDSILQTTVRPMGEFVDFDPSVFPYEFECPDCGEVLRVSHEEAEGVADATATVRDAVDTVRRMKGWWVDLWDVKCPDCVVPLEERKTE